MTCYIVGTGTALPERVVTNVEIAPRLGVTSEWIEANSGIKERRWVDPQQSTSEIAANAVRSAIEDASLTPDRIDYLIGATLSPDYQVPGIAPLVQRRLEGLRQIPSIDIRGACTSILYALQLGRALVESTEASNVVCFGAEAQSKGLDLTPEAAELSMLFGDGAGALLLSDSRESPKATDRVSIRIEDILISTDGSFAEDLIVQAPGTGNGPAWFDASQIDRRFHRGRMNGRSVILQAVRKLYESAVEICERNAVTLDQIEVVVPHQANLNLLRALSKKLAMPENRFVINVDRLGNTSSASAFIALSQAHQQGRLTRGSLALILAFGSGFTWGAALCRAV